MPDVEKSKVQKHALPVPYAVSVSLSKGQKVFCFILTTVLFGFFMSGYVQAQLDERYHTYEEMVAELESLALTYPGIMRVDSIGISTQDSMVIWSVKISDNVDLEEDEPAILYNGVHHAEEVLGLEICLSMINELVSRYGQDGHITWWVDNIEIWFVPLLNPEGHKVVTDGLDVTYRKTKRDNNENGIFDFIPEIGGDIDGVDPNRNYDFNWERGDTTWSSDYYRGPAPFSEGENRAIRDLALSQKFIFAILYHSARSGTKEVIYYPWCWADKRPPDFQIIENTAEEIASLIPTDDGIFYYVPWCSSLRAPFARDWFYVRAGTIPILIEVGSTIQPHGSMVDDICERNKVGAYYLLDRVMEGSITGTVTDSVTGLPLEAEVTILEASGGILSPRLCDPIYGRYRRILLPGSYTLEVSKAGYRTKHYANIPVNPSSPTVINIELAPLPTCNFTGTVNDIHTGDPLNATLIMDGSARDTVITDPNTGEFDVTLFEDTYVVNIVAYGYVAAVETLNMVSDKTVTFHLYSADTLFTHDFEGGLSGWLFGGTFDTWDVTNSSCHSTSNSLTDSPNGLYINGNNCWASTAQSVDLSSYASAALIFWHEYHLEPDFDSVSVELSADNGLHWQRLGKSCIGTSDGWVREVRDLTEWCGTSNHVRIRFRLITDGSVDDDGWYLDDVLIVAGEQHVAVEQHQDHTMPQSFHLGQNYPNPFNPSTNIRYRIVDSSSPTHTALKIFNTLGQEVRTLVDEMQTPGDYTVTWNGRENSGRDLTSGIYLYRLQAGWFTQVKKMILLR